MMVPMFDEGIFALVVSFFFYSVSLLSRGKTSVAHGFLYNGLSLLSPTNDCVALIAGVSVAKEAIPKNLKERLDCLQISSKRVTHGMVAVDAMTSKNSGGSRTSDSRVVGNDNILWKTLERTCCLLLGCLLILVVRWVRDFFTRSCCSDLTCWMHLITDEKRFSPFVIGILLVTLHCVLSLGKMASRIPPPSTFQYSPSSYLLGWGSAILMILFKSSITSALEELAVRILLLCRLVGVKIDDESNTIQTLELIELYFLSFLIGYIGFVLSDPLSSTVDLVLFRCFSWKKDTDQSRAMRLVYFLLTVLIIILPWIALVEFNKMVPRQLLLGIWCISLIFLAKPLLQTHLSRSISAVVVALDTKASEITSEKILHPFSSRRGQLVSTGAKILTTPSLVAVLIILARLCSNDSIYPMAYGGSMTPAYAEVYHEIKAVNMSRMVQNSTLCKELPLVVDKKQKQNGKYTKVPTVNRGRDLLKDSSIIPVTVAGVLSQVQKRASGSIDSDRDGGRDGLKDRQQNYLEVQNVVDAIIHHPLITSTIALPILDFLNWYLMSLWCLSVLIGLAFSSNMRKEIKSCTISRETHPKST